MCARSRVERMGREVEGRGKGCWLYI
jgi:hypothetical protein